MDNVTVIQEDHHIYYTSVFHPPNSTEASNLWVELNGEDGVEVDEFDGNTPTESELSGLHRYYQVMTYCHLNIHINSHIYTLYDMLT